MLNFFALEELSMCMNIYILNIKLYWLNFLFHSMFSNLVRLNFREEKGQVQTKLFELFKRKKKSKKVLL